MGKPNSNILLKDLFDNLHLSKKAYNVCDAVKLKTLDDLKKHFHKYGNFLNVRNCGAKTNKELTDLLSESLKSPSIYQEPVKKEENTIIKYYLSDKAIAAILNSELSKLSVRGQNGVLRFFGNRLPRMEDIKVHLIDKKLEIEKIKNIGRKSVPEIKKFLQAAISVYYKAISKDISDKEKTFSVFQELIGIDVKDEFWLKMLEERKIPILKFIVQHVAEIFEFNDRDTFIFKNHYRLLEKTYSMDEMAKMFAVTRERIRQRRDKIIPLVGLKVSNLSPLIDFSEYVPNIFNGTDIISITTDVTDENIRKEILETSEVFALDILPFLCGQRYYSIGPLDKLERPVQVQFYDKYNLYKVLGCSFLIADAVISKSDILKICSKVLESLSSRQNHNIHIDTHEVLADKTSERALAIVRTVVYELFDLTMEGCRIVIPRNSRKKVFEYVYGALVKLGRPSHISDILETILLDHPEFDTDNVALRAAINNKSEVFIHFGRTSTYGLKAWEEDNDHIKGGTIRDIVEEFLIEHDSPCHISSITRHVNKYRKSDERSILTNLKFTRKKIFFFNRGGYVGLVNKNYSTKQFSKENKQVKLDDLLLDIFQNKMSSSELK